MSSCGRYSFAPAPYDASLDTAVDAFVSPIGCADGEREGLTAEATIAACAATWNGPHNLRAAATGAACGDDVGMCAEPADACGAGWHVCADDGSITELQAITGDECAALVGRYVAASDHCASYPPCEYTTTYTCSAGNGNDCIQPICCGDGCDPATGCKEAVWAGATFAASYNGEGCAELLAVTGVLCCRD